MRMRYARVMWTEHGSLFGGILSMQCTRAESVRRVRRGALQDGKRGAVLQQWKSRRGPQVNPMWRCSMRFTLPLRRTPGKSLFGNPRTREFC